MNKNLKLLIALIIQGLIVTALVIGSQKWTELQNANIPSKTYVYKNIYFDYPGNWEIKLSESDQGGELTVTPAAGSMEEKMFGSFYIMFLPNIAFDANWKQTLADEASCSGKENTQWHQMVEGEYFSGFECVWKEAEKKYPTWEFFLYNEGEQTAVSILVFPINDAAVEALHSPEAVQQTFPNLLALTKSLRIAEK